MFKRLLFLALLVAAVWYGSKHYKDLISNKGGDIEVVNHAGRAVERLRISDGTQTVVVEVLENGATRTVPFQPRFDGTFHLVWSFRGQMGEREWTGGTTTANAIQTHRLDFQENGDVLWSSALKAK